MPNPKTCVDCMEQGNIPVAKWKREGMPFPSKFIGMCSNCKEDWNPGELIQRWDKEDQTKYTHMGCGAPDV